MTGREVVPINGSVMIAEMKQKVEQMLSKKVDAVTVSDVIQLTATIADAVTLSDDVIKLKRQLMTHTLTKSGSIDMLTSSAYI